jgi:PKD repeat protein
MVVRTGNIQMVVSDISSAMSGVANLASRYNGYVVTSQQGKQGERNVGSISIRIAAENFEKALSDLRGLAKSVTFESTSSQDVTEEYVDLEAKEKNLEATESQLRKIMEGATKTEDILSIQRELTNVRTNIEQAKGRMQYLERTTSTSLIQIQLEEAVLALKFTANKISVSTDEAIQFTSEIAGGFPPYSYQWDFGDGKTSNEVSPSHAYKDQGVYFVSLKVTDDKGYTNTLSREAYVNVLASWKPGSVASSAWNGLAAFGRVLVNVLIWLGIFSPVWIIIGGIIWWSIWRRKRKRA